LFTVHKPFAHTIKPISDVIAGKQI